MLIYQIFVSTMHGKKQLIIKTKTIKLKTINLVYQLPSGIINLDYLMDLILYQIFKIISSISSKNMKH